MAVSRGPGFACTGIYKVIFLEGINDSFVLTPFAKEHGEILAFNTPAKKYKTIVDAIASIEHGKFKQTGYNKWLSETRVEIENPFKELRNHWNIRNFPDTSRDAVRSHIALLFLQFLVLNLFKQYVLEKKYHKAQLKTLRTQVFDIFDKKLNSNCLLSCISKLFMQYCKSIKYIIM